MSQQPSATSTLHDGEASIPHSPIMEAKPAQKTSSPVDTSVSTTAEKAALPVDDGRDHTLRKRPWRRYVTPWSEIVSHPYAGFGTDEDPYLVDWLPADHENPMTWKPKYKWTVMMIAAVATLAVSMASSTL
jgi:hypothetical protein